VRYVGRSVRRATTARAFDALDRGGGRIVQLAEDDIANTTDAASGYVAISKPRPARPPILTVAPLIDALVLRDGALDTDKIPFDPIRLLAAYSVEVIASTLE